MGENSIARIYQFLSDYNQYGDWKADADQSFGNGDGTLIKTEVRSFLEDNDFEWFSGDSEAEKKDLINKFWASIDTKTTGNVGATRISNKNALDANEIEVAEKIMASTEKVKTFMSGLPQQEVSALNFSAEQQSGWMNSVKDGIVNKLIDRFKTNKSLTVEDVNDSMLTQLYEATKRKATADYAKYDVFEKNSDLKVENYSPSADKTLNNIVEKYIRNVGSEGSLQQIYDDVKNLVEAYADTANTNTRTDELKKYGYNENGKLNMLQNQKLANGIKKAISDKVDPELYTAYGSVIDSKAEKFIEDKLKGYKASQYTSIDVNALADEFITKEIADIQAEYDKFVKAKAELKELIGKYSDEKYKPALKDTFGKETVEGAQGVVDTYKDLAEVEAAKTKFEAAIKAIDDAEAAEKARKAEEAKKPFNWNATETKYTTHISENGDRFTYLTTKSLSELYNGNTVMDLIEVDDMKNCSFKDAKSTSIANLTKFIDTMISALSGLSYDKNALTIAKTKLISLYETAINDSNKDGFVSTKQKETKTPRFEYDGEAYEYQAANYYYNESAVSTTYSSGCSAAKNQLGLRVCYEYDDKEFKILVNARCVMDIFQKFYQQALGA